MRDRLLRDLRERLRRYRETGDPQAVLARDARWEAIALTGPHTGVDVEAYVAAAEVRWLAYRIAGKDRDPQTRDEDLHAALTLYGAVLRAPDGGPGLVPPPVRMLLE
ncbi:hypothetical protein ACIBVL_29860 [Streptomyces sp. NPDC049687]|uniref:hypothetical protein n=1 Tax=Streptomyces sp. NPDC049687 TaxID=3365596 RepID=UPI00379FF187